LTAGAFCLRGGLDVEQLEGFGLELGGSGELVEGVLGVAGAQLRESVPSSASRSVSLKAGSASSVR